MIYLLRGLAVGTGPKPRPEQRSFSRDEVKPLRKRPGYRHLEEATRLRLDDQGAARGEERRNLLLRAASDGAYQRVRAVNPSRERVRVLRHRGVLGVGE